MRWSRFGGFSYSDGTPAKVAIHSLVIDPHHPGAVWAGLRQGNSVVHGIFKTDDPNKGWTCVYPGQHYDTWAIAFAPSKPFVVYAASTAHQIIRSIDGGENWMDIGGFDAEAIAVDPIDPLVVFVVRDNGWGGMKTTTAGGDGWRDSFEFHTSMKCIAIDPHTPSIIFVGTRRYNEADKSGIIRSTDSGKSWARVFDVDDVNVVAIDPVNSKKIYAGTIGSGLFRSIDGGATWTKAMNGITHPSIGAIAVDPTNSRMVYVGTRGDGVFRSTDGGESWTAMNIGLNQPWVNALAINPQNPTELYAGTDDGVYIWSRVEAPAPQTVPPSPAVVGIQAEKVPAGVPGGIYSEVPAAPEPAPVDMSTAQKSQPRPSVAADETKAVPHRGYAVGLVVLVIALAILLLVRERSKKRQMRAASGEPQKKTQVTIVLKPGQPPETTVRDAGRPKAAGGEDVLRFRRDCETRGWADFIASLLAQGAGPSEPPRLLLCCKSSRAVEALLKLRPSEVDNFLRDQPVLLEFKDGLAAASFTVRKEEDLSALVRALLHGRYGEENVTVVGGLIVGASAAEVKRVIDLFGVPQVLKMGNVAAWTAV